MSSSVISINHLGFGYDSRPVLEDISFEVHKKEILTVMGGSGCGKSTLLNLIAGRLHADKGEIQVLGLDPGSLKGTERLNFRKRIGVLFQSGALLNDMNVYENVAFPLREHTQLPERLIRLMVLLKLQMVGLRGSAHSECQQLSGGMARRVALARALSMDPELLLYDEPFSGLDPIASAIIARMIVNINHSLGTTSIVVSHHLKEAYQISDRICLLAEGGVRVLDKPDALSKSEDPLVQQFVKGSHEGPVKFHHASKSLVDELKESVSD